MNARPRHATAVVGALLTSGLLQAQDPADVAAANVFVEVEASPSRAFVQQPVHITLRLGVERGFLATNLIQTTRQPLDLPLRVEAPWLDGLAGTVPAATPAAGPAPTVRVGVNGDLGRAHRVAARDVGGRRFEVFELRRRVLPLAAGTLTVPAPKLRFDHATRFTEDFFGTRVPADRRPAEVAGAALEIPVAAWPTAGRPAGFTGAVGTFELRATATPRALRVGDSLRLALEIRGDGNVFAFPLPVLDLPGFHLRGSIEERDGPTRRVVLDLAPLAADVEAVPPLVLPFLDPTPPGTYREATTAAIPLEVAPLPGGEDLRPAAAATGPSGPGIDDLHAPRAVRDVAAARDVSPFALLLALVGPWLLAAGLLGWRRTLQRRRADPLGVAARAAAGNARRALQRGEAPLAVFTRYLAARLRGTPAIVVAPELADRLLDADVPSGLARAAAALHLELTEGRFGGHDVANAASRVAATVEDLERAFRAMEAGS